MNTNQTASSKKGPPIPVRFDPEDTLQLNALSNVSKIPVNTLIRAAVKYALPLFASGQVNVFTSAPDHTKAFSLNASAPSEEEPEDALEPSVPA